MLLWSELTDEQKCVVAAAAEESDLFALLFAWNPDVYETYRPGDLVQLRQALLVLVDKGIVEVFPSTHSPADHPLGHAEVVSRIANTRAWWNNGEPLEDVVWIVLSDLGNALLEQADAVELRRFWAK